MVRADPSSTERPTMPPARVTLAAAAIAVTLAGCGSQTRDTQAPSSPAREASAATRLDGLYLAKLDRRTLRHALASTNPPVSLPGGWWTLLIDSESHRLVLSHADTGDFSERLAMVDDSEIQLAPSVECEQRGPGRTQPSRLAWSMSSRAFRFESIDVPRFTTGTYLRFQPIDVPCRTTNVLLTSAHWHKA